MTAKADAPIYQIKITLRDSKPPIWRRVLVRGDVTLGKLHDIIQIAMGWTDSHLHQFIVKDTYYGVPSDNDWYEIRSERRVRLNQIAPIEGSKFTYEYDFGDDWLHQVLVEKILPLDPTQKLPVCKKGRRACPPEDVGGVWGYSDFVEIMQHSKHKEHKRLKEWYGGKFDPEEFDLDLVNIQLRQLR
jgi:hypothetical protein